MQKIIVFDFDNTLVKSLDYWYKVTDKLAFFDVNQKPNKNFPKMHKHLGNKDIAKKFIEVTNVNLTIQQVKDIWAKHMEYFYTNKVKLIKGAVNFLNYLKSKNYTICLASATDYSLLVKALKHFDLLKFFDYIFTEDTLSYSKREVEFFNTLLNKLNTKPQNLLFFEDSFTSIKNATSLGINTVCLLNKYNLPFKKQLKQCSKLLIKNYNNKKVYNLITED